MRITIRKLLCWLGLHRWLAIAPCRDHDWNTKVCWWCGVLDGN